MNSELFQVGDYLLQRERMLLIDAIVEVDAQGAVARSVTTDAWPLCEKGCINPIVIIELVAQTAGIAIRNEERWKQGNRKKEGGGLIVGVKKAVFFIDSIPLDTTIVTCSVKQNILMNYAEYCGFSKIGDNRIGEVTLQLLRTD